MPRNFSQWRDFEESLPFALRDYQAQAIAQWIESDCKGLFTMATGTGKTLTAIAATTYLATVLAKNLVSSLTMIVCPYLHLVDQWATNLRRLGVTPVEACEERASWEKPLGSAIRRMRQLPGTKVVVVSTISTYTTPAFQEFIKDGVPGQLIAIYDEAHNMGSVHLRQFLCEAADYRLGLSATPDRWQDPDGTNALQTYFMGEVFSFPIQAAIAQGVLTPYDYHPVLCKMSLEETNFYRDVSDQIAKITRGRDFSELTPTESLRVGRLLRRRSLLLGTIRSKQVHFLSDFLGSQRGSQLVYCAPGKSPIDESMGRHIEFVRAMLVSESVSVANYEASTPRAVRQETIKRFATGEVEAILSMRCLDEGVDIPTAKVAYFVASGTNPREFIQRRGRVLRKSEGKDHAIIFDYFALPSGGNLATGSSDISIIERELARARELAAAARNSDEAMRVLLGVETYAGITAFRQS